MKGRVHKKGLALVLALAFAAQGLGAGRLPFRPFDSYAYTGAATVKASSLNVRSGPGTGYSSQGRLAAGASIQIVGEQHQCNGLWYARPVINETYDIEALSKHMSKHNTPFSPGVIKGVLADMVACVKELVLDGKNVKLDDLAIFSVGIESDHGAATAAEFKVSEHVKGLKLRARATGELSNAKINLEGTLRELTQYYLGDETAGGGITPDDDEEEDNDPSGDGETGGDDGVTEDPLV